MVQGMEALFGQHGDHLTQLHSSVGDFRRERWPPSRYRPARGTSAHWGDGVSDRTRLGIVIESYDLRRADASVKLGQVCKSFTDLATCRVSDMDRRRRLQGSENIPHHVSELC